MSGHNKWSKIKHKKTVTDAKRSREFSRLVRTLKTEAREAGGNTESPGLKTVIDKAKAANMPKDNIERAIRSVSKSKEINLETVTYETYGPGGVAVVIEVLTDNKNRTGSEIKHLLSQKGLSLASPGSASWAFNKEGDEWKPKNKIAVSDSDGDALNEIVDMLEDHEDVRSVHTNTS